MAKKKATKKRRVNQYHLPKEFREELVQVVKRLSALGTYPYLIKNELKAIIKREHPERDTPSPRWLEDVIKEGKVELAKELTDEEITEGLVLAMASAKDDLRNPRSSNKYYASKTILELAEYKQAAADRRVDEDTDQTAEDYRNNAFDMHTLAVEEPEEEANG